MRTAPDVILISNGAMSGNISSSGFNVDQVINCAVQAVWTGAPSGSLALYASNDNSTYTQLTGSTTSVVGTSGNQLWNIADIGFEWIQLQFANSSGTGTLNASITTKGF